jgi:uncharacterized membrane protein YcaP (DUF421 family)
VSYLVPTLSSLRELVVPDQSVLEIVIRISVVYLFLFFMLRFVLKREAAVLGVSDLLFIVLLADGVQNGMAGDYNSVTDALFVGATLIFWVYTLDYLGYRFPFVQRLTKPPPLRLIRHGRLDRKAARRELLTLDEIMAQLRAQGISRIEDVEEAYMEPTGEITAIPREGVHVGHGRRKPRKPLMG